MPLVSRTPDAGPDIFLLSTFDDDHLPVKEATFDHALSRLEDTGHQVGWIERP